MDDMENKTTEQEMTTSEANTTEEKVNNEATEVKNEVTEEKVVNNVSESTTDDNKNSSSVSAGTVVINNEEKNDNQRIEMIDQSRKDILSLISPKQQTEEFHLINKKNLPQKKDRYAGYEYKPPSKFKIFLLVIFMLFIIGLVAFLPEVDSYVKRYLGMTTDPKSNEITTGRLICKTTDSNNVFNYNYDYVFAYTDKKLDLLTYTNTTKGSKEDAELLETRYNECKVLSSHSDGIEGVTVTCELKESSVIEKQIIDYNKYDRDQMISAFVEAGGNYPDFELGADIDVISKRMVAANYLCEKSK